MNKFLAFLLSIIALTSYAQVELPAYSPSDEIVKHEGYALKYNEEHEQADWVAYELTKQEVFGKCKRTDNFREDPLVRTGSATLDDYRGSGYDRGHLIPAGDAKWSKQAMSDTFYLSNMSPMKHSFNAGIWERLEGKERDWAIENQEISIVSGPVLKDELTEYIGKRNKVAVPKRFYKIILDDVEPELKMIAFVIPHDAENGDISIYAMTVREAEGITGFDFFPTLQKDLQEKLETELDLKKWGLREGAVRIVQENTETTQGTSSRQQDKEPGKVQTSVDTEKMMLYAVVILCVILAIGATVLVIGIKLNRKSK